MNFWYSPITREVSSLNSNSAFLIIQRSPVKIIFLLWAPLVGSTYDILADDSMYGIDTGICLVTIIEVPEEDSGVSSRTIIGHYSAHPEHSLFNSAKYFVFTLQQACFQQSVNIFISTGWLIWPAWFIYKFLVYVKF